MSLSASATSSEPVLLLRYLDVALVALAAPIMVLIGVSAVGYLAGAGAWVALRSVGVAVERAATSAQLRSAISIRLGYLLGRLFLLALVVILVRRGEGRDAGLAALLVIVFAFTVQLVCAALTRPRRR